MESKETHIAVSGNELVPKKKVMSQARSYEFHSYIDTQNTRTRPFKYILLMCLNLASDCGVRDKKKLFVDFCALTSLSYRQVSAQSLPNFPLKVKSTKNRSLVVGFSLLTKDTIT